MFEITFKSGKKITVYKEWRIEGWVALGNVISVEKVRRPTKRAADGAKSAPEKSSVSGKRASKPPRR